jgi:Domain of unknown function (DUF4282)
MNDLVQRFWGFDKLLGPVLVKIVYYLGLGAIALGLFVGLLGGLFTLTSQPISGLVAIVAAPIIAAVVLMWWRFLIEICILAFEMYARLGEIRDRLPAPPAPPEEPTQF